jgi:hypothetical protein
VRSARKTDLKNRGGGARGGHGLASADKVAPLFASKWRELAHSSQRRPPPSRPGRSQTTAR